MSDRLTVPFGEDAASTWQANWCWTPNSAKLRPTRPIKEIQISTHPTRNLFPILHHKSPKWQSDNPSFSLYHRRSTRKSTRPKPPPHLQVGNLSCRETAVQSTHLSQAPFVSSWDDYSPHLPRIISHRGYKGKFPENTLAAVQGAVQAGTHALEIDLHLSRDGVLVLSHVSTSPSQNTTLTYV